MATSVLSKQELTSTPTAMQRTTLGSTSLESRQQMLRTSMPTSIGTEKAGRASDSPRMNWAKNSLSSGRSIRDRFIGLSFTTASSLSTVITSGLARSWYVCSSQAFTRNIVLTDTRPRSKLHWHLKVLGLIPSPYTSPNLSQKAEMSTLRYLTHILILQVDL